MPPKFNCFVFVCMAHFFVSTAQALPAYGKLVGAIHISLQGGSNSGAQWQVPSVARYKIWLQIPANSTATNAKYRLYPKGNIVGNKPHHLSQLGDTIQIIFYPDTNDEYSKKTI